MGALTGSGKQLGGLDAGTLRRVSIVQPVVQRGQRFPGISGRAVTTDLEITINHVLQAFADPLVKAACDRIARLPQLVVSVGGGTREFAGMNIELPEQLVTTGGANGVVARHGQVQRFLQVYLGRREFLLMNGDFAQQHQGIAETLLIFLQHGSRGNLQQQGARMLVTPGLQQFTDTSVARIVVEVEALEFGVDIKIAFRRLSQPVLVKIRLCAGGLDPVVQRFVAQEEKVNCEQQGEHRHGGDGMIRNVAPEVHGSIHGTPIGPYCKRVLPAGRLSLNIADMPSFDLDPDYRAFIESYLAATRLSTASSVSQQRADYQQVIDRFRYPYPQGVVAEDSRIEGRHGPIPLRHYRCTDPADGNARILFVHGGGFILGSLDSHDDICAELCARTGYELLSISYRLAPEFHHPVQLDDVEDGFRAADRGHSILVGVSAGGTLCAALGHRLRQAAARPAGQVLIYPSLGGDSFDLASYRDNAEAPLLTTEDIRFYRGIRCMDGIIPLDDAEYYPLVAKSFEGLPPTVAQSADIDPLRDDAGLYVQKLQAAGIAAEWLNEPGLTHDYLRARHLSRRAGEAFSRVCDAILRLARNSERD